MATREFPIVGDSLALGYRFQRYWDTSMANAFFCGELGAGVFLVSLLYGSVTGMIIGVSITAILKTYFHLSHMGVPGRSWRAILRPDRSWISRGAISIVLFSGAAILHILISGFGALDALGLGAGATAGTIALIVKIGAIACAMFVMTYHGFAIADSQSISFWNTGLMPISSFSYSALGGLVITTAADPAVAGGTRLMPPIHSTTLMAVVITAVIVIALLNGANRGSPGAKMSLRLLTREGPFYKWFIGLVLIAGLLLPFVLLLAPASRMTNLVTAAAVLVGYYTFRLMVFKVGLYDPLISFSPES